MGILVKRSLREDDVMAQARGYTATKEQLKDRLARIEGQVRGVARMVEEDRYCIDVLTQISAIQAALDRVALGLLDDHARHCLVGGHGGPSDPEDQVQELMGAVGRMLSR
jgi:CsoR family transcriptional regulator, copper-sensing transcriptional repressor